MFLFFSLSPLVLSSTPSLLHVSACVRGASPGHQFVGPQPASVGPRFDTTPAPTDDGCEPRCAGVPLTALFSLSSDACSGGTLHEAPGAQTSHNCPLSLQSGLRIWALVALCHRRSIAPGRYCCKARYPQVESSNVVLPT
ncbi:hypothetical protein FA13DRAFT_1736596 [Coprinellus micaceus]|uniref:Uncharacterized protein n=1 Tax=Coprinellus micaceus TaxID=71717 RepID=A0A4Y7T014_COPMI|nr:hypothetical protein FA13DRAFT_1736596 [Coprinellus micaceus]